MFAKDPLPAKAPCCTADEPAACRTCITPAPAEEPPRPSHATWARAVSAGRRHVYNLGPGAEPIALADMRTVIDTAVRAMARRHPAASPGAWTDDELEPMRSALDLPAAGAGRILPGRTDRRGPRGEGPRPRRGPRQGRHPPGPAVPRLGVHARATWAATGTSNPFFAPEVIAASILREFNDRRFLALLREHNPTAR